MVLVSAFLLAAIAVYRDRKTGASDTFRALWGVGVVSLVLSIAADFAPTIAGPFAVLVVLGSLTDGGDQLIQKALGKVASGGSSAPARGATGTASQTGPVAHAGNTSTARNQSGGTTTITGP
jgi:hypothetical protein